MAGLPTSMDVFAQAQGTRNEGKEECHWCASKCQRLWTHDDPQPASFTRSSQAALRPGNAFVCVGCHLWRRRRVTVPFFGSGEYKDGKSMMDYSCVVTGKGAWAVRHPNDNEALYRFLLSPPTKFVLSLIDRDRSKVNLLQLAPVNWLEEVRADTELVFLLNGVRYHYSVYELEEALRSGVSGRLPGAQALVNLLGPFAVARESDEEREQKRQRGRPKKDDPGVPHANRKVS